MDVSGVSVIAWPWAFLLLCLLSTNANVLLLSCRYLRLIFLLLSISHDTPSVDTSSRQALPSHAAATSQACCTESGYEGEVSTIYIGHKLLNENLH